MASFSSSRTSIGAVLNDALPRSKAAKSLISATRAESRAHDFSVSSSMRRYRSSSVPAGSFSTIRRYPATTLIGVRSSWEARDRRRDNSASAGFFMHAFSSTNSWLSSEPAWWKSHLGAGVVKE
jgi:hypothetical protein